MTIIDDLPLLGRSSRYGRLVADLVKYGFASVAALALDFVTLLFFYKIVGLNYLVAAAIGFLSGLALVYALSVRYVFGDRRRLGARHEIAGFLITGVAGLALTEGLMHFFVDYACVSVALAKIPTAGVVFVFNFTARRTLLFSAPAPAGNDASATP